MRKRGFSALGLLIVMGLIALIAFSTASIERYEAPPLEPPPTAETRPPAASPDTPEETTSSTPSAQTPEEGTSRVEPATEAAAVIAPIPTGPAFPTEEPFASINKAARRAIVNIICTRREGRARHTVTGSGVIIDARGVILTTAHIAEFFLLEGEEDIGSPRCTIRAGNPAEDAYRAELLYISPTWIASFAPSLSDKEPVGTGEEDFALLLIVDTTSSRSSLPESFDFLPYTTELTIVLPGHPVLVAGYPAIVNTISVIEDELYLVSALARIQELFTFDEKNLDLFSLDGSIASEHGSSGGAVVSENGGLIGIVVSSGEAEIAVNRTLQALTLRHISDRLERSTSAPLEQFLTDDLALRSEIFEKNAPVLKARLLERITRVP